MAAIQRGIVLRPRRVDAVPRGGRGPLGTTFPSDLTGGISALKQYTSPKTQRRDSHKHRIDTPPLLTAILDS